jgi:hypothetical protein
MVKVARRSLTVRKTYLPLFLYDHIRPSAMREAPRDTFPKAEAQAKFQAPDENDWI